MIINYFEIRKYTWTKKQFKSFDRIYVASQKKNQT